MKTNPTIQTTARRLLLAATLIAVLSRPLLALATTTTGPPAWSAATLAGLPLISPDAVPQRGTFYRIQRSNFPPLPFNNQPGLPVYALGENRYLVDDRTVDYAAEQQAAALERALRSAEVALGLGANSADGPPPLGEGEGTPDFGSQTNAFYSFSTNDLWLEVTGVTNSTVSLVIHPPWNATTNVYYLFNCTDLTPPAAWQWLLRTDPGQTNLAITNVPDTQAFYRLGLPNNTNPPVAADDPYETLCPNAMQAVDLSIYASDPYNLPLTYIAVTSPLHGTLTNTGSGHFLYTPNYCYEGVDSFTFKVNDAFLDSNTATVTLTVGNAVYTYYVPATAQTCKNTPLPITLYAYDSCGTEAAAFAYAVSEPPTNGTLSGTAPNLVYTPDSATFTGRDSFTYTVSAPCGIPATNTVAIVVGAENIVGISQAVMTGTNQPVNITLTASDSVGGCVDASLSYSIVDNPTHGTLAGIGTNRIYTPATNFEGVDTFTFTASDGVWTSSPAVVSIYVVAGPQLVARCRSDRVVLNWDLDNIVQQMLTNGLTIQGFQIFRSTQPDYHTTNDLIYTAGAFQRQYIDTTVTPGTTYYYVIKFTYQDDSTGILYTSPYSNEISTSTCEPPYIGPIDVAFIIDNTYSMNDALSAIKESITLILKDIAASSSNDFRLAIVTPDTDNDKNPTNGNDDGTGHDMVVVRLGFTNSLSAFTNKLRSIQLAPGNIEPESTDECLNTVVNALAAIERQDVNSCASTNKLLQLGDFAPGFRTNAQKRIVLITDVIPSGFCDAWYTTNQAQMYAIQARGQGIKINAILTQSKDYTTAIEIMTNYATLSCGWYELVLESNNIAAIENAIISMLYDASACN